MRDRGMRSEGVERRRLLKAAAIGGSVIGVAGGVTVAMELGRAEAAPQRVGADAATARSGSAAASASGSAAATHSATASAHPSASAKKATAKPSPSGFAHPGLLHSQADLDRMAAKVAAGAQPWTADWNLLVANPHAQTNWKPNPLPIVYRGTGSPENYGTLYNDIHAAYQNGLRYHVSGDKAHAQTAVDILNAWSATLTSLQGTADRFIAAGIYGYQFANAAELVRDYPGFELERFQQMMLKVFYPLNDSFLTDHNGAYITNYWGSWDELSYASVLAIGILCDRKDLVNQAIDYFRTGTGPGAITNAIPVLYPGGLGQWLEVGRDQGHATLGIGLVGAFCQMAWNQGYDMYGFDSNRFLAGAEYTAQYNIGESVPYTKYVWNYGEPNVWSGTQTFTAASPDSRGDARPIWEMLYNHYVVRQGLSAPALAKIAAGVRPEGGGGNYGPNSGGYDQLGFGTLAYTL